MAGKRSNLIIQIFHILIILVIIFEAIVLMSTLSFVDKDHV